MHRVQSELRENLCLKTRPHCVFFLAIDRHGHDRGSHAEFLQVEAGYRLPAQSRPRRRITAIAHPLYIYATHRSSSEP